MSSDTEEMPTRTQLSLARKADEAVLAKLASDLVEMSPKQRGTLELEEVLDREVRIAREIKRGALKRQLRVIRGVLRGSDHITLGRRVHATLNPSGDVGPVVREVHAWMDRFDEGGHPALEAFLEAHPNAERQKLRTLIRNARAKSTREGAQQRPKKPQKVLERRLAELIRQRESS